MVRLRAQLKAIARVVRRKGVDAAAEAFGHIGVMRAHAILVFRRMKQSVIATMRAATNKAVTAVLAAQVATVKSVQPAQPVAVPVTPQFVVLPSGIGMRSYLRHETPLPWGVFGALDASASARRMTMWELPKVA